MREWQSQAHVKHYCRYHSVFVPKYRKKSIYGALRRDIGKIFQDLCRQYGIELIEGHAMGDHVHSVPRSGGNNELSTQLYLKHAV